MSQLRDPEVYSGAVVFVGSAPTLESWEQDRKQPIGTVRTLIAIALSNPEILLAVAAKDRS
jgi:DNA-binding transcriptional regulator YiaG